MDDSGPREVIPPEDPAATEGCILRYRNGVEVHHKGGFGAHFYGADGEVKVNRGRFEFILDGKRVAGFVDKGDEGSLGGALDFTEENFLKDAKVKLYNSHNHLVDFIECVQSRKQPITSAEVGGRSAICCHLMNQAYYNHTTLKWKPKRMRFTWRGGDDAWLTRDYRAPWTV